MNFKHIVKILLQIFGIIHHKSVFRVHLPCQPHFWECHAPIVTYLESKHTTTIFDIHLHHTACTEDILYMWEPFHYWAHSTHSMCLQMMVVKGWIFNPYEHAALYLTLGTKSLQLFNVFFLTWYFSPLVLLAMERSVVEKKKVKITVFNQKIHGKK